MYTGCDKNRCILCDKNRCIQGVTHPVYIYSCHIKYIYSCHTLYTSILVTQNTSILVTPCIHLFLSHRIHLFLSHIGQITGLFCRISSLLQSHPGVSSPRTYITNTEYLYLYTYIGCQNMGYRIDQNTENRIQNVEYRTWNKEYLYVYIYIGQITGLFCRISSLLQGTFAKETYNFKEPTNHSHPICVLSPHTCGEAKISRLLKITGLFYRALLQKRPIILRSLLILATPYVSYPPTHILLLFSHSSVIFYFNKKIIIYFMI